MISVDWGGGSLPLYSQAAANTRVVGLEVAHFINTLIVSKQVMVEYLYSYDKKNYVKKEKNNKHSIENTKFSGSFLFCIFLSLL